MARQSLLFALLLPSALAFADEAAHWGYQGEVGPAHWAALKPEYQQCKLGKTQSPIDIRGAKMAALPAIEFSYQAVPLHLINNGHTIQASVPAGSFITVGSQRLELLQFHFHHPSETELNGHRFPLELHLVHQDAQGKLAVVAVLLADGPANAALEGLWKYLPKEQGKESAPEGVTVDPSGLLPANRAYFTFPGSLTTPPCSEDVTWYVLRTPVRLSKPQVSAFAQLYPDNARPVQPPHGRTVQMSK